MDGDPMVVALRVAKVLEGLDIPYVIGGSIASTFHGEPRTTADVDFAIQLSADDAERLAAALEPDFFLQESTLREAARRKESFNVIHRPTMMKVDFYVRPAEGIYASEVERAQPVKLSESSEGWARVATAEDTVLQKLRWYRQGGDTSARQWRDVRGVIKACGAGLDSEYLRRWAIELGIEDLLDRMLEDRP